MGPDRRIRDWKKKESLNIGSEYFERNLRTEEKKENLETPF